MFSLLLCSVAIYLLKSVDWKIAIGVFLFIWANNITENIK
jgi:hypothetical protein